MLRLCEIVNFGFATFEMEFDPVLSQFSLKPVDIVLCHL